MAEINIPRRKTIHTSWDNMVENKSALSETLSNWGDSHRDPTFAPTCEGNNTFQLKSKQLLVCYNDYTLRII